MAYESGDLKVFNPNKEISKEITLEILIRHRDAMKQARTGEIPNVQMENVKDNDRKMNQVKALNLVITAQRDMITIARPNLYHSSLRKWQKKYRDEKDQQENPISEHENDYNSIKRWLEFLTYCELMIREAEKSKTLADDFIVSRQTNDGTQLDLTDNFRSMLEDLEDSYEQIYLLLLINKIVSAGIEEDEELTYKEKEQEAIRRIVEA